MNKTLLYNTLLLLLLSFGVINAQECQFIENQIFINGVLVENNTTINVCLGEDVHFQSAPLFPENGTLYYQSIAECNYYWIFGDGKAYDEIEFTKSFPSVGVYEMHTQTTDQYDCQSAFSKVTIRVSAAPTVNIQYAGGTEYHAGEPIAVYHSSQETPATADIVIETTNEALPYFAENTNLDGIRIPDGAGGVHRKELIISSFPTEATIGTEFLLERVWMGLFHAYSGDLTIELICPSGESVAILAYPSDLGSTNFGEHIAINSCNTGAVLELPFTYGFTSAAANGTLPQFDPSAPSYTYTTPPDETGQTYTITDTYFPAGDYQPIEDFSNLNTCPINGIWTLQITDHLAPDAGWLYGWGLDIANEPDTIFIDTNEGVSFNWEDKLPVVSQNADSTLFLFTETGNFTLPFQAIRNDSCRTDSSIIITITPKPLPEISTIINGSFLQQQTSSPGTFGNATQDASATGSTFHEMEQWSIWPNPATDKVFLRSSDGTTDFFYQVYDAQAKRIIEGQGKSEVSIDSSNWPVGVYTIFLYSYTNGQTISKKLIKVD